MVDVSFEVRDKDDLYNGTTDSGTVVEDDGTDVHYNSVHNHRAFCFHTNETHKF